MTHPDEKLLPAYIKLLQTSAGVTQLAAWLKQHYPASATNLRPALKNRFEALKQKEGMPP